MSLTFPPLTSMSSNSIGAKVPSLATNFARTFALTLPGARIRSIWVALRPDEITLLIAGITTRFCGLAL